MANTKTYYNTLASVASAADSDIIVVQTNESSDLSTMKKTTVGALRQKTIDMIASNAHASSNAGSYVFGIEQNETGRVDANLKGFDIVVDNSSTNTNAPTSLAVKKYVQAVRNTDIASDIRNTIESLDVNAAGGEGKYIKKISEVDGKIIPVEESLEDDVARNTNKAPATSAVKTYVDSKIGNLNLNTVGGSGKLIQSITQTDGAVTATTISLDQNLSSSASKVPTSEAVYNAIGNLTGTIGNSGTLVKSISEVDGKVTGETIVLAGEVSNNENAVPTSQAVYNKVHEVLDTALDALDYSSGAAGYYFDTITQNNGQILTTSKKFDTYEGASGVTPGVWKNGLATITPNDENVISTKAAKSYTDWNAAVITKRIDDTNFASLGQDGFFLQTIKQSSGAVTATTKAFKDDTLASYVTSISASAGSYANNTDTAPTVRAVTEQIQRLDGRIDDANAGLTNLTTGPFGATGAYIAEVSQNHGFISASLVSFVDTIAASTDVTNNVAPTENAVRKAINDLDVAQIGENGRYIRFVVEADGKINATPVQFDHFASNAEAASWADKTDDNSPSTLAVYNFVNRVKEDILEKTKSMTYEGTVGSYSDLAAKVPFDKGDTFIASAPFNLESSSGVQIQYNVNKGDMLICKNDSDVYNKDNFDIIGGSEYQIVFDPSGGSAVVNNFPVFKNTDGTILVDSGESIATLSSRQNAASYSASAAACSASYAASVASYAQHSAASYIEEISSAASYTASCASYARTSSNAASLAASQAQTSSNAASLAASQTQNSSRAAHTAELGAQNSSNAASIAASRAQTSSDVASLAASLAAVCAANAAADLASTTSYMEAASSSAACAANSATIASDMKEDAIDYADGARGSSNAASIAASHAQDSSNSASLSASKAASFASDANLEYIKNSASLSAACAASSASLASSTVSNKVDKTVTGTQTINSNLQVGTTGVTISTSGIVSGTDFVATSSRKVKENVKPSLISALDVIDKVNIVNFNYIYDDEKTPHIGFIAEDTPELLSTPHKNKMDYTNCIGTLIKAVQEITKGIEELKKEVDSLK